MAAAQSAFSAMSKIDAFSFGKLNEALDELSVLNTKIMVPPEAEFHNTCHRVRVRSGSTSNTFRQWRIVSQRPLRLDVGFITKENMDAGGSGSPCEYGSEGLGPKLVKARPHRARINPYYHRKPLYSLWGRASSLHAGRDSFPNRLNGCQVANGDYYLRSLRSVNSLPRLYESDGKAIIRMHTTSFEPSSLLFEDELKRKTEDYCSYPIPVPMLTRSKSLEDLRESVKPKLKSLSTDMSSSGSSFDASLSPRRTIATRNFRSENLTTFPMLCPRRILENGSSHSPSPRITSREMDSMSLLIGNLDVS